MKSKLRYTAFILFILWNLLSFKSNAQNCLELKDNKTQNYIGKYLETLYDKTDSFSLKDALESNNFKPSLSEVPNLGISPHPSWVKFNLINLSESTNFIIRLALATIDYIDYYAIYEDGHIDSVKTGDCRPFKNREFERPDFVFKLTLNKTQKVKILFKISSGEQLQAPIIIGEQNSILMAFTNEDTLMGIYLGIILVMILYNLFIFFSIKDKNYLFYIVYILIVGITQLNFNGYAYKFIWPNSVYISSISVYILSSLVAISAMEFMKRFLSTKENCPRLHRFFILFYIAYYAAIILCLLKKNNLSYQIIQFDAILASSFMIFVAARISLQGYRPAKYFVIAWSTFLIGVSIFVFKDFGILPYNKFTNYTMQLGSAIETILLSFALADRINILKIEKEQSQAKMLLALKENEKLIKEQNIILEQKVEGRTIELKEANQNLTTTLSNLKEAQTQLVNAEKMASLGQLTAGIAHEINNPVNFISGSLKPLKMDILDLVGLIEKYEKINKNSTLEDILKEIDKYKSEIDIDYIIKEMEMLLLGIEEGTKRTQEIVSGLKTFSRLDENEVKEANINEGIEATLLLLKHTIPKDVFVILELGKIPFIECLPGKLNQVFMNIISNSIFALNKKKTPEAKQLIIKSYASAENVFISIEDTGIGMTPEVKNKIFDPFFTTKDVGEGTGLGMSIVYKILETHQAKIEVGTTYGKGTKIIITLKKKLGV
jgi:two-component system, NtrC family, sensor kinase